VNMELTHTATRRARLSAVLREDMGISMGLMNRLKWQDKLFVNGIPQHTNYPVEIGDVVTIPLDDPETQYPAQDGALTILYEDEHLLIVDKPAGMLIHPSRSRLTDTLANYVLGYYEKTGQSCAFHPITRLDRDTFGVVLLAKNAHVHALCNQLHNDGKLQKTYRALVYGGPENETGIIDAPIARLPLPSLLRTVSPEGKPSLTEFKVLQRRENCSLLELKAITGRTHQLRVHCSHMGYPILGDPQYGSEASKAFSENLGLTTQQLCAYSLEFPHPITKQYITITTKMTEL
jgi:23S rRNA pseudouridine1911/1915/1917 synthase